MGLFKQPPLGANAVAIAHDQHADHQFGINRRTPNRAIEVGEVMASKTAVPAHSITVPSCCVLPAGQCRDFAAGQTGELLFNRISHKLTVMVYRDEHCSARLNVIEF